MATRMRMMDEFIIVISQCDLGKQHPPPAVRSEGVFDETFKVSLSLYTRLEDFIFFKPRSQLNDVYFQFWLFLTNHLEHKAQVFIFSSFCSYIKMFLLEVKQESTVQHKMYSTFQSLS